MSLCHCECNCECQHQYECKSKCVSVNVTVSVGVMKLHSLGISSKVFCKAPFRAAYWETPKAFPKAHLGCFVKFLYGILQTFPGCFPGKLLNRCFMKPPRVYCEAPLCAQASFNTRILTSSFYIIPRDEAMGPILFLN